jgi:hypothetical protein
MKAKVIVASPGDLQRYIETWFRELGEAPEIKHMTQSESSRMADDGYSYTDVTLTIFYR